MAKRHIPDQLRRQVRERAKGRCEYCLLHEETAIFRFEPDHIIAEKHRGATSLENLAWSCGLCNRYKGTDISSVDPVTNAIVPLFNPRCQQWRRHFRLNGPCIEPLTVSGRATEAILQLNHKQRITQRLALMAAGKYPPH
jgi:5-methylcytosine-specific restriction endonuclease McrA